MGKIMGTIGAEAREKGRTYEILLVAPVGLRDTMGTLSFKWEQEIPLGQLGTVAKQLAFAGANIWKEVAESLKEAGIEVKQAPARPRPAGTAHGLSKRQYAQVAEAIEARHGNDSEFQTRRAAGENPINFYLFDKKGGPAYAVNYPNPHTGGVGIYLDRKSPKAALADSPETEGFVEWMQTTVVSGDWAKPTEAEAVSNQRAGINNATPFAL